MTYSESFPYWLTHAEVRRVMAEHYVLSDISDFHDEFGIHPQYKSRDLLNWLGY